MKRISLLSLTVFLGLAALVSSCVPVAVGAAAGYVAHKEGYRVQNPITKTENSEGE